ncbi:hypothetical protein A1D25_09955 [Ursidibacter arcticus]|uniref:hypothetical protein n=1 Tax=Ursidibacter arcticus TaxID=1524965 RepID=UPI0012F901CD|nr:hypothetical protein [Ursidibacter arcticus]KAE9537781.1 hypothetical protein A1D25_09955 [Ursidibacter arcticus]
MNTQERIALCAVLSFIFLVYIFWISSALPTGSVNSIYFIQNEVGFFVKLIGLILGTALGGIGGTVGYSMGQFSSTTGVSFVFGIFGIVIGAILPIIVIIQSFYV